MGYPDGSVVKNLPADAGYRRQERRIWSLGREDPPEEKMATHTSVLAWKIPWTEEPSRLQSMGSQSRTQLSTHTHTHTHTHTICCTLQLNFSFLFAPCFNFSTQSYSVLSCFSPLSSVLNCKLERAAGSASVYCSLWCPTQHCAEVSVSWMFINDSVQEVLISQFPLLLNCPLVKKHFAKYLC